MVTSVRVAVTTVTMATVVKDAATVVRVKRVITSRERATPAVRPAGLDPTVTEVRTHAVKG